MKNQIRIFFFDVLSIGAKESARLETRIIQRSWDPCVSLVIDPVDIPFPGNDNGYIGCLCIIVIPDVRLRKIALERGLVTSANIIEEIFHHRLCRIPKRSTDCPFEFSPSSGHLSLVAPLFLQCTQSHLHVNVSWIIGITAIVGIAATWGQGEYIHY